VGRLWLWVVVVVVRAKKVVGFSNTRENAKILFKNDFAS